MAAKLREAAARGNTQEVLRLLDEGAKIQPDDNGRTALHLAASAGHADVVAALLLSKCDVNLSDSSGCTALQRAAADGHLDVVQQLLKHGADVNRQDNVHGNTALHEASWKGYSRCVEALGKSRANLHLKNCGGFAALHLCCQNGHNQSCRELLLAGCNPDLQNNYGDTPLHTSARYGHAGVTRILISAQCKVSEQNKNGDTALHIAAAMGRRKLTRILLEASCDKNLKNKQNETARDIATRKDLNEILVILGNTPGTKAKTNKSNDKKREKQESGTSSKDSSTRHKDKKKHKNGHKVHFEKVSGVGGKQWSPYGCHYYPDPKAFPKPKLDSLPNDPLIKGEQYYLDLAGNICKGPVGVGYTCYCAPFFKHMEERLDRDKQELKQHIDQAHERLDEKVTNLERRTHGQLSELTRCVAAERALCDRRHMHLAQWIERGGKGRSSERVRGMAATPQPPLPRARSMEMLMEQPPPPPPAAARGAESRHRTEASGKDRRSLEVVIDGPKEMWRDEAGPQDKNWRKQKHRSSSHEMSRKHLDLMEITQEMSSKFSRELPKDDHNRSFDALVDRDTWRGQPHRRSANELPTSFAKHNETSNDYDRFPEHNRSFDGILHKRELPSYQPNKPHHKSTNMIPVPMRRSSHNRSFDILVDKEADSFIPQRQVERQLENRSLSPARRVFPTVEEVGENVDEWRGKPARISVHEMVAKFQSSQSKKEEGWRASPLKAVVGDKDPNNESAESHGWTQDYLRAAWSGNAKSPGEEDDDDAAMSESSDEEDQVESTLVSELPYRSRTAVYSPDLHNDSGYSTKLYGSSKGPSPSLSGHLDCDGLHNYLVSANVCEQLPPRPPLPRTKEASHVVTASLV